MHTCLEHEAGNEPMLTGPWVDLVSNAYPLNVQTSVAAIVATVLSHYRNGVAIVSEEYGAGFDDAMEALRTRAEIVTCNNALYGDLGGNDSYASWQTEAIELLQQCHDWRGVDVGADRYRMGSEMVLQMINSDYIRPSQSNQMSN